MKLSGWLYQVICEVLLSLNIGGDVLCLLHVGNAH